MSESKTYAIFFGISLFHLQKYRMHAQLISKTSSFIILDISVIEGEIFANLDLR